MNNTVFDFPQTQSNSPSSGGYCNRKGCVICTKLYDKAPVQNGPWKGTSVEPFGPNWPLERVHIFLSPVESDVLVKDTSCFQDEPFHVSR